MTQVGANMDVCAWVWMQVYWFGCRCNGWDVGVQVGMQVYRFGCGRIGLQVGANVNVDAWVWMQSCEGRQGFV